MNKFYGNIGYVETVELEPGYWGTQEKLIPHYGEWTRYSSRFQISSASTNDDKTVANELSIVADPSYDFDNFSSIRFIEFAGEKWQVTAAKPQRPRIILTIGGIYNGTSEQADVADEV